MATDRTGGGNRKGDESQAVNSTCPNPEASEHPASARLTMQEFLSVLALGLGIAALCAMIAFLPQTSEQASGSALTKLDPPRKLIPFHLTDRTGRLVTDPELLGKFVAVNFAFTSCSLSCRAANDHMRDIQRLVANMPDVQLVSISVDPGTDTPAVLAKFADSFGADPDRWLFLTGDKVELYRLIETSFISRSADLTGVVPGGFAQTDRIMLVDRHGNVCGSFNGLSWNVATNVVAEIKKRRRDHQLQ